MRVLFLIDTLETGGAEKSLLEILPRLRHVQPVLCHLYAGRSLREAYERAGVTVISLDLPGPYSFLSAIRRVRGLVREHRPALIHSTLLRSDLVARMAAAAGDLPVINSFVNQSYSPGLAQRRGRVLRAKYQVMCCLDRLTASRVTLFVANSHAAKASSCRALGVPVEKVRVIYRGRDTGVFRPAMPPQADPGAGRLREGSASILAVARLHEKKGLADIIRAMPAVLARFPGARLTILGEGPARKALEALVKERCLGSAVALPGASDAVAQCMRAADLLVSASYAEGLSGGVIEGMLTGLPLVLSDIDTHREMTADGATAMLFRTGDSAALASTIVSLLERPEESRRLGRLARETALERFDVVKIAPQYAGMYAEVLDGRRRRR